MKLLRILSLTLLFSGCGTEDPTELFTGDYVGTVSRVLMCPDVGPRHYGKVSLKLTPVGDNLMNGSGSIPVTIDGDTISCVGMTFHQPIQGTLVQLNETECSRLDGYAEWVHTIVNASIKMGPEDVASLNLRTRVESDWPVSLTCHAVITGDLQRL